MADGLSSKVAREKETKTRAEAEVLYRRWEGCRCLLYWDPKDVWWMQTGLDVAGRKYSRASLENDEWDSKFEK